jgi:putative transposase
MRRIDKLFLECPFYGSRQMVRHLCREGLSVGRHRVRRLMRLMGLQAIYQAPRTSRPHPEHRVYPYLLKGLAIERPHQVWSADITYIPVQKGFLYLVAVMDWATRRVLSFRLSNTLDARFCTEALTEALERYGRPEIFNSDQGSQFTSLEFTSVLKDSGVAISMDGRGRCMDNIFIERLWRSLKYEAVYLHEISDGFAAQRLISRWFAFYDKGRPHSALGGSTPAEAYEEGMLTQRPAQRRSSPAPLPALPEQQDVLNRTLAA